LSTRLKSASGHLLQRTVQDKLMLQLAYDALKRVASAERIFAYANPGSGTKGRMPAGVMGLLFQYREFERQAGRRVGAEDPNQEGLKWFLNLPTGPKLLAYQALVKAMHVGHEIAQRLEDYRLAGEDDDA
jgi:hypothetical protein